jgi:hypothetical protein
MNGVFGTKETGTLPFVCDSAVAFLLFPSTCKESPIPPKPIPPPRRLNGMQHMAALARDLLGWISGVSAFYQNDRAVSSTIFLFRV